MRKISVQLALCLFLVAVLGLQQIAMVGAIAPPGGDEFTYHMYGTVKHSGTGYGISGATVNFYGNGAAYLGSAISSSSGSFNYYTTSSIYYNYVKAQVSKTGYQTTTKNAYNVDDTYYFGSIYLVQLKSHHITGYVENDVTSDPVYGVEVKIYAGNGGDLSYISTISTASNGWFSTTIYSANGYDTVKVVLTMENYYQEEATTTGSTSFYFGTIEIHPYQKIGVFFYVNPGYQVTEEEIDGQIDAYQGILVDEGFTRFFVFQDTDDFEGDFASVANYEREHDVVFLYTFSHGDDSGWLKLGGATNPSYKVNVGQVITCLESLDSNKVGWLVTACFSGHAYDEAVAYNYGQGSDIFLITSSDEEISQFYEPGDGATFQAYRCAFAYPFFNLISAGYDAIEAYDIAEDDTHSPPYTLMQYPLMYNGLDDYTFFD